MSRKRRLRAPFFLVASVFDRCFRRVALAGCASGNNLLSDVVRGVVGERFGDTADPIAGAKLNPDYRYLRVEVVGHPPALLVLGYVDPHVDGDIEVWYSAKQEVIKTQNGRIIATFGLETDWRSVRLQPVLPPWAGEGANGTRFERMRDEMPGYRYAITDQIESRRWPTRPPQGVSAVLGDAVADRLQWFREGSLRSTGTSLPPAWFARGHFGGRDTIVYSEQCLAPSFCLRLMRWPLQGVAG
jgi:hypothetical protein